MYHYGLKDSASKSVITHDAKVLRDMFKKYEYEIRIVGGAVRDVLMGKQPKDLDFVTTATVQQMKDMFANELKKKVDTYAKKPDTIIVCFTFPQQFKITTIKAYNLRWINNEDWILDAKSRDFTINSMFLDFNGTVHDSQGGYDDLKNKKVRFIGDVDQKIKEDHLRILRYFRFYSQLAEDPAQHEDDVLQAIKNNAEGLKSISGQRIWKELKIILQGKSRHVVVKTMALVKILPYIGLWKANLSEFQSVSLKNRDTNIEPASLLAALLIDHGDINRLHNGLTYSSYEKELINFIIQNRKVTSDDSLLPYLKLIYGERKLSRNIIMEYVRELLQYKGAENLLEELQEVPKFPVTVNMLKKNDILKKNHNYTYVVEQLVENWYENDYDLSAKELLKLIPNILQEYMANL